MPSVITSGGTSKIATPIPLTAPIPMPISRTMARSGAPARFAAVSYTHLVQAPRAAASAATPTICPSVTIVTSSPSLTRRATPKGTIPASPVSTSSRSPYRERGSSTITGSGSLGSLPVSVIWLALLLVGGWVLLHRTRFGVNLQALGGSETSALSAGIAVVRVRILAYTFSGVFSALAGVVLAGLTQSGDPTIGAPYLLDTIATVVIGGTSLVGGVGTIVGTVLGAVVLSLVSAVLLASGLSTYIQYFVSGGIVVGALLVQTQMYRLKAKGSARRRQLALDGAGPSAA